MEPTILGYPITLLLFYFIIYSFLGWAMETTYCSIVSKKLVARGFLHGPICPIYGGGVLLMILFFSPLKGNIALFLLVSTLVMSTWEYLVAWFLETTTHIKYWDYSNFKFNLQGRICLWVCAVWGLLSYVCIFWIHPAVAAIVAQIPDWLCYVLSGAFTALLAADAVVTIRSLAQTTLLMQKLETVGGQLQTILSRGKMELDGSVDQLKTRYGDLLAAAERQSRRFRRTYEMTSQVFSARLDEVRQTGAELADRVRETANAWRRDKKKK